jgi:hypothetical protein
MKTRPPIKAKPKPSSLDFAHREAMAYAHNDRCVFCEMTEPGDECPRCHKLAPLPMVRGL